MDNDGALPFRGRGFCQISCLGARGLTSFASCRSLLVSMSYLLEWLCNARLWNIAARTTHLAAMGILLGGHAFDRSRENLLPYLVATVITGVALAALEAGPRLLWFHQLRGLMTLAKLVLLAGVPLFWPQRMVLLLVVVVLGSVGSHMPARYRYYSVVYREVIRCHSGPGVSRLNV